MAPDVMHDILEGVVQFGMMMVLKDLILKKHYFQLPSLNDRIKSFNYGPVEAANKPSTIKEAGFSSASDTTMKQTGKNL